MRNISFASLFTGIGGFDLPAELLGMVCTQQTEKNAFRQRVLSARFPDVPKGGDIFDVTGSDLGDPEVIFAGFPCKDLSIGKGHRAGLAGERSGLYWEFHRLVGELLRLARETRPRFVVLENVPGLTEFNDGRDLALVLMGLEDLGYGWAYRLVDSRDHGSDAKRPRIIIVGHLGGDARPAWRVLADPEHGGVALPLRHEPPAVLRPGLRGGAGEARIVRKSSRPRATADKGGYSTWVDSDFLNVLTPNDAVNVNKKTDVATLAPVKETHHVWYPDGRMRTLTPREWERGQNFPDDWTLVEGATDADRKYSLGDALNCLTGYDLTRRLLAVMGELPMIRPDKEMAA